MAKNDAKIDINVNSICSMNEAQHESLAANVLGEGRWENQDEFRIWMDHGTLMVQVMSNGSTTILLGIEQDGYTHS